MRRRSLDGVAGATAVGDAQYGFGVESVAQGPTPTRPLDDGARIDEHAIEIKQKRRTPELHKPLIWRQ